MLARSCLFAVCICVLFECSSPAQEKAKHQPPEKSVAASSATSTDEEPAGVDTKDELKDEKEPKWSIETPPGPSSQQAIDVAEGTWISVDVHPSGEEIVFDLLG